MFNSKIFWILGISFAIILVFGSIVFSFIFLFNPGLSAYTTPVQTGDANLIATAVAQTIEAELTTQAAEPSPTSTNTPEPTVTRTPTTTQAPEIITPASTVIPPTMIVPTFTPISTICNRAQFVRDISVEDNSLLPPGASIVKTWRLKNIGHCTWTTNYMLVFQGGNAMEANRSIRLPRNVEPNQTIDLSVALKAPQKTGTYRGDWMLSGPTGNRFGIGSNGDQTFWVQIRVKDLVNPDLDYDFAANYCRAEWSSGAGKSICPGTSSGSDGFVILLDNPKLEVRQEDELALWTHPNNSREGWISGMYPEFTIQPGYHFKAWVGCLEGSKGCNVVFRLDFKNLLNGNIRNLGSWHEVYDGEVTKIDLDLSRHAGKRVRFILTVEINGGDSTKANAFWFVPGIVSQPSQTATSTPTITQIPTGTTTPTESPTPTDAPTSTQEPTPKDSIEN